MSKIGEFFPNFLMLRTSKGLASEKIRAFSRHYRIQTAFSSTILGSFKEGSLQAFSSAQIPIKGNLT